jgi:hypothetical protein
MISWFRKNWLPLLLIALILLSLRSKLTPAPTPLTSSVAPSYESLNPSSDSVALGSVAKNRISLPSFSRPSAPTANPDRLIIRDTSLSLVVKDVAKTISEIENSTRTLGGFLASSNLSKPESGASGTITIRVPENNRTQALAAFKQLSVKVVSESVLGTDVTDQYTDLEAQLITLNQTKTKFQEIMSKATAIADILNVQQQLINIQSQIDAVKGQQQYLEGNAKLSKIAVYLSTDELSLPYTPNQSWRPSVIFKEAIRSLILNLRSLGTALIWLLVYSPIIVPIIALVWYLRRRK